MPADQPTPFVGAESERASDRPWYGRILIGVSAWLTTCLMLGFFAVLLDDWLRANSGLIVAVGLFSCGAGLLILRLRNDDFFSQAATALLLAGLGLLMAEARDSGSAVWLSIVTLCAVLYFASPGAVYRFLVTLALAGAVWGLAAALVEAPAFSRAATASATPALAWVAVFAALAGLPQRRAYRRVAFAPLILGLVCVSSITVWSVTGENVFARWPEPASLPLWKAAALLACAIVPAGFWAGLMAIQACARDTRTPSSSVGAAQPFAPVIDAEAGPQSKPGAQPATSYAVAGDAGEAGEADGAGGAKGGWVVLCVFLLAVPWLMAAPGVALALTWLLMGFAFMRVAWLVLGALALLTYLGRFYYMLELTLLQKAAMLAIAGVVCLAIAALLSRVRPRAATSETSSS